MVDIARPASVAKKKKIRRIAFGVIALVAVAAITLGVSQLKPAAPTVERAAVWVDTVKQGPMLRLVRGSGTLVPEEIRWIPARTSGRVERIVLRPGATVTPGTVILELSNPELQQQVKEAELAFQSAQASFQNRKTELESQLLQQQACGRGSQVATRGRGPQPRGRRKTSQGRTRPRDPGQAVPLPRGGVEEPAQDRGAAAGNGAPGHQVADGPPGGTG